MIIFQRFTFQTPAEAQLLSVLNKTLIYIFIYILDLYVKFLLLHFQGTTLISKLQTTLVLEDLVQYFGIFFHLFLILRLQSLSQLTSTQ